MWPFSFNTKMSDLEKTLKKLYNKYDPNEIEHIVEKGYNSSTLILYHKDSGEYNACTLETFESREKCERFIQMFTEVMNTVFPLTQK